MLRRKQFVECHSFFTGKTSVKSLTKRQKKRELNRDQRRHQAMQIRQNKRDEILSKKRSIGGASNAPFLGVLLKNKQFAFYSLAVF